MSPRPSNRALSLQASPIRKLHFAVERQVDVEFHRLNIGQPDVHTPEVMLEALDRFRPNVIAYGPASGFAACRQAAAAYHSHWYSGLSQHDVAVTTGGSEALLFAFAAVCDPGDEILVPEPYYANYNGFALIAGVLVKPVRTHIEEGFALPSDAQLDAAVSPKTKAIVFSNPCNPTGAVYPRKELERLLIWARRRNLWVIADEVYRRIWFKEEAVSTLEFEWAHDRLIVIDSLSKTYSACGARLGFLISRSQEMMERVERLGQSRLGPQPLAQHMAIAAMGLPDAYYVDMRRTYEARIDSLFEALALAPQISAPKPEGAFYTMLKLPIDDSERFARFLVEDFRLQGESVVVAPGGGFYAEPASGRHEVRIAAVVEEESLRRSVKIIDAALDAYNEK